MFEDDSHDCSLSSEVQINEKTCAEVEGPTSEE
jgi:hypothetical protein